MTQIKDTWEKVGDIFRDNDGNVVEVVPETHRCTGCVYEDVDCYRFVQGKNTFARSLGCGMRSVIFKSPNPLGPAVKSTGPKSISI